MTQTEPTELVVTKKAPMLIVHLSGTISRANRQVLDQMIEELSKDSSYRFLVLEMSKLDTMTLDIIPAFVQFQKTVRSKDRRICLCSMNDDLKGKLVKLGITRANELAASLKDAVDLFVRESKQATASQTAMKKAA